MSNDVDNRKLSEKGSNTTIQIFKLFNLNGKFNTFSFKYLGAWVKC